MQLVGRNYPKCNKGPAALQLVWRDYLKCNKGLAAMQLVEEVAPKQQRSRCAAA